MALSCAQCAQNFCGWCHRSFKSDAASHEHLRSCKLSLSHNGSPFANAKQIADGQAIYRRNKLNDFLGQFKTQERNMIVIELAKDLADLQLDSAAFLR